MADSPKRFDNAEEQMELEMHKKAACHSSDDDEEMNSDSSDNSSVDESVLEAEGAELDKKISDNPYDYQAYVDFIKLLQKWGELDKLRKVREKMSLNFPLTPTLWLSWLQDEIKLAASDSDRKAIYVLFERAVQDYISVEIWLEYAQFSIGDMTLEDGIQKVRSIFDRALTAVGIHVAKGACIWEAYREFENVLYSQNLALASEADDKSSLYEPVMKLFTRQLSVPLCDMQNTYAEFSDWIREIGEEIDTKNVERGYKKALDKLSTILTFEDQLLSCPSDRCMSVYRQYIAHEMSAAGGGDPSRIQLLYERAIAEELTPDAAFWLEYIEYLDTWLRIESVVLAACQRAVRNCPWSSALWQHLLRSLEHVGKPHEEIKGVMESALLAGFSTADDYRELWLSYIDYLRRRTDFTSTEHAGRVEELIACFNRAIDHLTQYFGSDGDPTCVLLQYWARVEAMHRHDLTQFRLLWNQVLGQSGNDKMAAMWLEYAALERSYGNKDGKHLRRLYARAVRSVQDWPESVGTAWLNFERDVGTLDSFELCLEKFRDKMKEVTAQREKLAAEAGEGAGAPAYGGRAKQEEGNRFQEKGNRKQERAARHQERNQGRGGGVDRNQGRGGGDGAKAREGLKRKHNDEGKWASNALHTEYVKKAESTTEEEPEVKKVSRVAPPPGYKPSSSEDTTTKKPDEAGEVKVTGPVVHDSSKDNRTVFVSNLDFSITEEQVKETFVGVGTVTDLRLVKDFKGRSKGFGFIEFSSVSEAAEALKRDRQPIGERPMFVSKCDPDKQTRQPVFKYSNTLEKNKIFIKGLPLKMTKEDLEEMYKPFGALKEVRLVTYRNGHSKGLAYIDFTDSAAAAKAVLKTDGLVIQEKTITVAISQPPERRNEAASLIPSLGGGGDREMGGRGRVKMASSLVPRSVQILQSTAPSSPAAQEGAMQGQSTNGDSAAKKVMSNQDFRQMLLGSKK